jgi:hypothetical protein
MQVSSHGGGRQHDNGPVTLLRFRFLLTVQTASSSVTTRSLSHLSAFRLEFVLADKARKTVDPSDKSDSESDAAGDGPVSSPEEGKSMLIGLSRRVSFTRFTDV